jgi:hypothetical protein
VSGEINVVIWLNPFATPTTTGDEDEDNTTDGLRIYDVSAAGCLYSQGISAYPSVHPDFLSVGGNLKLNVTSRCPKATSELVPRKANRMVIIGPRRPFAFSIPAAQQASSQPPFAIEVDENGGVAGDSNSNLRKSRGSFEETTSIALVITFSLIG